MKKIKNKILSFILFILAVTIFLPQEVHAQQTIITLPNSDALPVGTMILKESTRADFSSGKTRVSPSIITGIGHGMDFSFDVPVSINADGKTTVKSNIGLKKVWFVGPSSRLTAGTTISPYFNDSVTPDSFAYVHLTQKIKKTKTSVTVGGYISGENRFFNRGGVAIGLDQVIIPNKLRVACDWLSGENDKGNFSIGLKYRPITSLSITAAVIIPNKESDSTRFQLSFSKTINVNKKEKEKTRL